MIVSSQGLSTSLPMPDSFTVGTSNVMFSQSVKTLGVTLDTHLTMKNQVVNLVRTANFELRRINSTRHYLSVEATQKLVVAFVMSRLDYCNFLLYGCPQYLINRLQKVQNNAARLILKVLTTYHITPHLQTLHWLPVNARIQYKTCFYASMLSTPLALSSLLTYLRSMNLLVNSALLLTLVHCAFLQYTQKAMANVPFHTLHLLSGTICLSFKSALTTYMFQLYN